VEAAAAFLACSKAVALFVFTSSSDAVTDADLSVEVVKSVLFDSLSLQLWLMIHKWCRFAKS
jgi:hypothetical protein